MCVYIPTRIPPDEEQTAARTGRNWSLALLLTSCTPSPKSFFLFLVDTCSFSSSSLRVRDDDSPIFRMSCALRCIRARRSRSYTLSCDEEDGIAA